jgi:hypothetical protein
VFDCFYIFMCIIFIIFIIFSKRFQRYVYKKIYICYLICLCLTVIYFLYFDYIIHNYKVDGFLRVAMIFVYIFSLSYSVVILTLINFKLIFKIATHE